MWKIAEDRQDRCSQPGGLPEARSGEAQLAEHAPAPGLSDVPVHAMYRRGPLQEPEILCAP